MSICAANAGLGSTTNWGLRELRTYQSPLDLVRERSPERPVALARPDAVAVAARWFQENFKGDVFYAVKANPSPWVIRALSDAGIGSFDVASVPEIELVAEHAPGARMAFMHPVKSRRAIEAAYFEHGVRTFALDTHEELAKILEATGGAKDLNLMVRLGVAAEGATTEAQAPCDPCQTSCENRQPPLSVAKAPAELRGTAARITTEPMAEVKLAGEVQPRRNLLHRQAVIRK